MEKIIHFLHLELLIFGLQPLNAHAGSSEDQSEHMACLWYMLQLLYHNFLDIKPKVFMFLTEALCRTVRQA